MEESIEVVSSVDTEVETPSEPTETVVEPVEAQPTEPVAPVEQLFELPDGRKVDAETLSKEWKENFYPEYTRKSQALSNLEKITNDKPNPYSDPDYEPQSYDEIYETAAKRALQMLEQQKEEALRIEREIETEVSNQLQSIKQTDPTLDENALFAHATKYGFKDLPTAHKNMKDMENLAKSIQQQTVKNVQKRNDPVSDANNKNTGTPVNPANFRNAIDYMRALKGQ